MQSNEHLWVVILAAGEGKRVKDLTRDRWGRPAPKQYALIDGRTTLLDVTLERARKIAPPERIVTVVAAQHRRWWASEPAQLPPGTSSSSRRIEAPPPAFSCLSCGSSGATPTLAWSSCRPTTAFPRRRPSTTRSPTPPRAPHVRSRKWCSWESTGRTGDGLRLDRTETGGQRPPPSGRFVSRKTGCSDRGRTPHRGRVVEQLHSDRRRPFPARSLRDRSAAVVAVISADARRRTRTDPGPSRISSVSTVRSPTFDFSKDLLERSADSLWVHTVPACGWLDLGTPERLTGHLLAQARQPWTGPKADSSHPKLTSNPR